MYVYFLLVLPDPSHLIFQNVHVLHVFAIIWLVVFALTSSEKIWLFDLILLCSMYCEVYSRIKASVILYWHNIAFERIDRPLQY